MIGFIAFLLVLGYIVYVPFKNFRDSKYEAASGNGFIKTFFDKGNYGEYLTYLKLQKVDGYKRIMTNLYIPGKDGKTTEVDLLMITETGLYVVESKNYSGWIFGSEKSRYWMQMFPNKQKHQFFNPIWQNSAHINAIKGVLDMQEAHLFKSYIIFSERCTLKKIDVVSPDVKVMKRNDLTRTLTDEMSRSEKRWSSFQVDSIFSKLFTYSRVDDTVKKLHIEQVREKRKVSGRK
ncbi:hypothetical protein JCM9140_1579 [Halalkalibacter wakoensis JCM 9140]|uniref:NERD domain-containing protein n=1 Tax=Halalkalibacter wakoensis JCM 9140 TaxID=1236970 RepID=W4Q1I1_9BACI|nr:nuclease-related domain-containing protein [Halalkalibacter wakoensis]GAE25578.1 hypothetical protein JCM9140_1579 [Halalkalibacter wakoensis JCM 9140]